MFSIMYQVVIIFLSISISFQFLPLFQISLSLLYSLFSSHLISPPSPSHQSIHSISFSPTALSLSLCLSFIAEKEREKEGGGEQSNILPLQKVYFHGLQNNSICPHIGPTLDLISIIVFQMGKEKVNFN